MSRSRMLKKKKERREAIKLVPALFEKAAVDNDQRHADRIIRKARRVAMKFRMNLSPFKHLYCKHCYSRLKPGVNSRVRINSNKVIIYCYNCRNYRRIPLNHKRRDHR